MEWVHQPSHEENIDETSFGRCVFLPWVHFQLYYYITAIIYYDNFYLIQLYMQSKIVYARYTTKLKTNIFLNIKYFMQSSYLFHAINERWFKSMSDKWLKLF